MNKSELIQLIEKKIVEQEKFMEIASPMNTAQYSLCMQARSQYSWFIEKLKTLNEETVKRELLIDYNEHVICKYELHCVLDGEVDEYLDQLNE